MKDGGKNREKISSLSASILSLGLTVVGFSDLKLELWWHYPITIVVILMIYVVCYFVVELVQYLNNVIQRASIKTDTNSEFIKLLESIDLLYHKVTLYESVTIAEYKSVLEMEIKDIHTEVSSKVHFIRQYFNSTILKDKGNLPDEQHLIYAELFCAAIKNRFPFLK